MPPDASALGYIVNEDLPGSGDFYCIVQTSRYEETLGFYRDGLRLPIFRQWERPDSRGTYFRAASGAVEVLEGTDAPRIEGVAFAMQVDDSPAWYARARDASLPVSTELATRPWGYREFSVVDPNGLRVVIFQKVKQP